jgi:nucleotide-binding universal stress UspA family protein
MLSKDKKDLIIVPFDFTIEAETALNHASKIAAQSKDEIRLVHIINKESKAKLKKENLNEDEIFSRLKITSETNKKNTGIETSYHAEEGDIFTTISEYAKDAGASLIVLGTHGVHGMQHIVGANSMKVIASCKMPVIVVQKKNIAEDGYKRIIVTIDYNKLGKNKIYHAASVAKYFNAEVHLYEEKSSDEFLQKQIKLNAFHASTVMKENNIVFKEVLEDGSSSFEKNLIRYASSINADLIVISTHQDENSIMELFFRSIEVNIINNDAMIAVMSVNPIENTAHLSAPTI